MHIENVIDQLKSMRLSVMADSLQSRLAGGNNRDLAPEEFFALLVEDEFNARKNRKLSRMISRANFKPEQACLENISFNQTRGFMKKDIMPLTTSTWINNAQNLVITGPTGCGKTYIAEAVGLQVCIMGFSVAKIRYPLLFEEVHAAKGTGIYLRYLKKLARIKVLILDDFLMQPIEINDCGPLLDIIEEKEQTGSIIITTQFPVDKWHLKLPDPTVADAICDRLTHGAIKFNLKGDSMRKEKEKSASK
ncbi:MAG: IS21-like element helper ATPase IstB [Candidatus Pacebacteria bacterium]|nr:IS21-like element helper ATPase IstB [Candidatus Paceibacterota bacterium]